MTFGCGLFCFLIASTAVHGQTSPPSPNPSTTTASNPPANFTATLNFSLREEKLPEILNYLIVNDTTFAITTRDILDLSQLARLSMAETVAFFNYFNITNDQIFRIDSLELLLKSLQPLDITFTTFYQGWARLQLANLDKIEDVFAFEGNYYKAISRNTDEIYDILRTGNFSAPNIAAAIELSGKTEEELFSSAKAFLIETVASSTKESFVQLLLANGWRDFTSKQVYRALNLSSTSVYQVDKFKNIFSDITDKLNEKAVLVVFTAADKLVLHRDLFEMIDQRVVGAGVRIEANGVEVRASGREPTGADIYQLTLSSPIDNFVQVTESYGIAERCQYFTLVDGAITGQSIEINGEFNGIRGNGSVVFQKGGPLVCGNKLYGLAREQTEELIIFDRFYTKDNPAPSAGDGGVLVKSGAIMMMSVLLAALILLV